MAEETNVALSDPTASGASLEKAQQDSSAKAADIPVDERISEPPKEGAAQEEAADCASKFDGSPLKPD